MFLGFETLNLNFCDLKLWKLTVAPTLFQRRVEYGKFVPGEHELQADDGLAQATRQQGEASAGRSPGHPAQIVAIIVIIATAIIAIIAIIAIMAIIAIIAIIAMAARKEGREIGVVGAERVGENKTTGETHA